MGDASSRVLLATPDFPPARGGIQHVMHRLATHASRVRVRIVTLDRADAAGFDTMGDLDVRRVGAWGRSRAATMARLNAATVAEALRRRPDAILSGHIVTGPGARSAARLLRVPFVQYAHADELQARPRLARAALAGADAVVAVSRHTARLAEAAGADGTRIHVIPPGVDLPATRPPAGHSDRPTVVTVARLRERYKGHDMMVRALPLVRARVPDVRWAVVGDGPLQAELAALADAYLLNETIALVGAVPDAERDRWLDQAHVFAMPSRLRADGRGGEGFGIVYMEAAARALPVVAGAVGGALDAVVDGRTGLLVDPDDHVALADAISDLLLDPARAAEIGRAAAERAREFAWPAIARRVEDLLVELITRA